MTEGILVIDTGSSSMRGILFDLQGEIRACAQVKYTMDIGADGSALMDAEVFADCLTRICGDVARQAKQMGCGIRAVALDSQRSSVLAVDRDIRPLHPILMWYDKRCAPICSGFSREELRTIYDTCGMRLTPVSSAPKMLWLKRNRRDIYDKAYKLIGIHDYLLYLLCGNLVTDATCACRSALMDIRTFEWSDTLLEIFQIDRDKLCPILGAGAAAGEITREFSALTGLPRVPVVSAGGDQQCCLAGQGLEEDTVSVNSGSASYLSISVSAPCFDDSMEVNLSAYYGDRPWILEASNMGSGTLYQWFNREFYRCGGDMEEINREVAQEPPGCRGMICLADFAGRGCPHTDPDARGMFLGVGLQHGRGSFARAILEGICFDIDGCVEHLRKTGAPVKRICSTGGLTRFETFNQMLADIMGMEVTVSAQSETTAAGTLRICLNALGLEAPKMPREAQRVYIPGSKSREIYAVIREEREKIRAFLSDYHLHSRKNVLY